MAGIQNEYDDGVPLRFCEYYLENEPSFMAVYGGPRPEDKRYFEAVNIPADPGDDFIVFHAREEGVALWAGIAEYIGKVATVLDVINIRKYPEGNGSEMDFRETMKILRRALCGHNGVEIFLDNNGVPEKIGEVDESRYLRKIPLSAHFDGNFDVLQKGISVRIVHR